MSQDSHDVQFEEYEESWTGRLIVAGVIALALIAGAFFAGKAMAGSSSSGPATLAEAVQQAQKGTLPCGDTATAAATPAATPNANGGPPAGGGAFLLRGICSRNGQGAGGQAGQGQGQGQGRGRFGGAGGFGGQTVTAVSPDSITVQGQNGSNTIKIDSSTTVSKTSGATVADIKKGDSVIVGGFGGFGGGGGGAGGANNQNAAARSITILPQTGSN
ncbi:hypothetical protein OM076_22010 [Solirubrobacter ginsenosidimutans]|uniref:DUF5666 domain-containing protein n=1 Tax=Solirubrobacter ginsenosidimutans TaxID=490573 RepID=A0A9X3MX47_9ACTN|nr:hypothetical protein [Solirubrobacter ginsenosidimutans]MDA0162963.1 hypothetical protein [Solirubrobacter ginsenosidimutans]